MWVGMINLTFCSQLLKSRGISSCQ